MDSVLLFAPSVLVSVSSPGRRLPERSGEGRRPGGASATSASAACRLSFISHTCFNLFSISSFISIESPLCICFSISWAFSPSFFQYSINRCPGSSDDSRVSGSVSRLFDSSIPASSLHCTSCSALTTAPATHRSIPATPRSRAGRSGVTLFFEPHVMRDLV